jgi:hypothetical protein
MRRLNTGLSGAILVFSALVVGALAAVDALGPGAISVARAQTELVTTVNGIQLPPPVPGLDYTTAEIEEVDPTEDLVVPATPTAPLLPGESPAVLNAPEDGGALTTSLGGSDVTVSSVGGSYEVDGAKKRSRKKR